MKKISATLLQAVIVLIGIAVLALMIWIPQTEGRAANLDLFSIYADPLILYGYVASIAFFAGLYKTFRYVGLIGEDKAYTLNAAGALKAIRYCALALCLFIVGAGLYINMNHHPDDDPAGFYALCIMATFICMVVATVASKLEKNVQQVLKK